MTDMATIRYEPVRKAARKGSKAHTVGHQWRCLECNVIVHTAPLIGMDADETPEQEQERNRLYNEAVQAHMCAPKPQWSPTLELQEEDDE